MACHRLTGSWWQVPVCVLDLGFSDVEGDRVSEGCCSHLLGFLPQLGAEWPGDHLGKGACLILLDSKVLEEESPVQNHSVL